MMHGADLWLRAVAITPNDSVANTYPAYQITATGNLVLTPMLDNGLPGADITYTGCPVGMTIRFPALYIKSTGTTATVIGLV
jgi:hypothetical protein